jgi:hypothetical protein
MAARTDRIEDPPMSPAQSPDPPQVQREAIDTLANLLGSLCEAGISVDVEGRITWLSDAYRRLWGYRLTRM